jgi:hypothetical protein
MTLCLHVLTIMSSGLNHHWAPHARRNLQNGLVQLGRLRRLRTKSLDGRTAWMQVGTAQQNQAAAAATAAGQGSVEAADQPEPEPPTAEEASLILAALKRGRLRSSLEAMGPLLDAKAPESPRPKLLELMTRARFRRGARLA